MTNEQHNAAINEAKADNENTAKMAGAGAGILAGAQVGTVLLPIPVVGTFTGALVGGLIGTKIGKKVGGVILDKIAPIDPTSNRANVAAEIDRLVKLKDAGIIDEEEFKAAKAKVLGL